jgi:AraC-like DNA-binding protein
MFRLEKSVELIRSNAKENFTGIAVKSGFKNVRSFNQSFKEYYRCTPSEYRKMLK